MKAYKFSDDLDNTTWDDIVSCFESELNLNPVEDINGDTFISIPEHDIIMAECVDEGITNLFIFTDFIPAATPV